MQNIHLVVIDPQNDFMDSPQASLAVPGANADMDRLAALLDRTGSKISDVHVTLDSHNYVDVGHPTMWVGGDGNPPPPFTVVRADDIRTGIWTPRMANAKPPALGDRTIKEYMISYASELEAKGRHFLMVWPVHCLIGSPGAAIQDNFFASLNRWAGPNFANVDFVTKGVNPWTEHYGALTAEVPMSTDPSTGLNTRLLEVLGSADMIVFAGEALTHCVMETIRQITDEVDPRLVEKFHFLSDCSSPIPKVGDGPDFPAMAASWLEDMRQRGMNITTSTEFLA